MLALVSHEHCSACSMSVPAEVTAPWHAEAEAAPGRSCGTSLHSGTSTNTD